MMITSKEVVMDANIILTAVFMEKMEILLILMSCMCVILAFLLIFSIIM